VLESPTELLAALRQNQADSTSERFFARILEQAASTAKGWSNRIADDRRQFLKSIIERVIINLTGVEIRLRVPNLVNEILGRGAITDGLVRTASIRCAFRHVQQGRAVRIIVGDTNITTDASRKAILKAISRARHWYEQLTTGEAESIAQLATMHNISPRFINMHLKLVQLSPEWIEKMMTRPDVLPLSLDDLLFSIPMNWNKQSFGMTPKSA
jgi:hypothetical protein